MCHLLPGDNNYLPGLWWSFCEEKCKFGTGLPIFGIVVPNDNKMRRDEHFITTVYYYSIRSSIMKLCVDS